MCSVSTIMSVVLKKKVLLAVPWILFSGQWTGSKDIHLALNLIKKENPGYLDIGNVIGRL